MRTFFEKRWWKGDSQSLFALEPLSVLFGVLIQWRAVFLRAHAQRLPIPVVVVGNITVGGSGKTPIIMALSESLKNEIGHLGIISRGYGRKTRGVLEVFGDSRAESVGDEPLLMKWHLGEIPIFVGEDRVAAAKMLLKKYPNTALILSDDGLQHYKLSRTFEIAVFDERGIGNGFLLPRGPLRESVSRLTTVDAILLNGFVQGDFLNAVNVPIFESASTTGNPYALENPSIQKPLGDFIAIGAVTGIGNSERFFNSLKNAGLKLVFQKAFPDHHFFTADDFENTTLPIFITEKDAVKCRKLNLKNVWVLPIRAQIQKSLTQMILEKIHGIARI